MKVLTRELHIVNYDGYRETYEEYNSSCNVERLWHERLCTNKYIERATLVYREESTGKIVDQFKLK